MEEKMSSVPRITKRVGTTPAPSSQYAAPKPSSKKENEPSSSIPTSSSKRGFFSKSKVKGPPVHKFAIIGGEKHLDDIYERYSQPYKIQNFIGYSYEITKIQAHSFLNNQISAFEGYIIVYRTSEQQSFDTAKKIYERIITQDKNTIFPIILAARTFEREDEIELLDKGMKFAKEWGVFFQKINFRLTDRMEDDEANVFEQLVYYFDTKRGGTKLLDKEIQKMLDSLQMKPEHVPEVIRKGEKRKYLNFLTQLVKGKLNIQKQSVMIVGQENVGKTTFLKRLLGDTWMGSTFRGYDTIYAEDRETPEKHYRASITDGIDINHMTITDPKGENISITFFDFAGQEIYYNTHSFFLCRDSVYFLMFNGRESLNTNRISHWIHTILRKAPSSSVFIIATHMEGISSSPLLRLNRELTDLVESIQFLVDQDKRLCIISPEQEHSIAKKKLLFWSISLSDLHAPGNQLVILIQRMIDVTSKKVQSISFPDHWNDFRLALFPNLHLNVDRSLNHYLLEQNSTSQQPPNNKGNNINPINNNNNNNNNNIRELDSKNTKGNLQSTSSDNNTPQVIDQMQQNSISINNGADNDISAETESFPVENWKRFVVRGKRFNLDEFDVEIFVDVLSSWGDLLRIPNKEKDLIQIVLNPVWLISIFKFFITAKRLQCSPQLATSTHYLSEPYILSYEHIKQSWRYSKRPEDPQIPLPPQQQQFSAYPIGAQQIQRQQQQQQPQQQQQQFEYSSQMEEEIELITDELIEESRVQIDLLSLSNPQSATTNMNSTSVFHPPPLPPPLPQTSPPTLQISETQSISRSSSNDLRSLIQSNINRLIQSDDRDSRIQQLEEKLRNENNDYILHILSQQPLSMGVTYSDRNILDNTLQLLVNLQLLIPLNETHYLIPALLVGKLPPPNIVSFFMERNKILLTDIPITKSNDDNNKSLQNRQLQNNSNNRNHHHHHQQQIQKQTESKKWFKFCRKKNAVITKKSLKQLHDAEIVEVERRYDMKFLPSGMFTQLMMSIWQWRKLSLSQMWENGFVVGDIDADVSSAVIWKELAVGSCASSIVVVIRCKPQYISELLPPIHRAVINIIQALEFENCVSVRCRIISPAHFQPYYFNYDDCLTSAIDTLPPVSSSSCSNLNLNNELPHRGGDDHNLPQHVDHRLLIFLIPELYSAVHRSYFNSFISSKKLFQQIDYKNNNNNASSPPSSSALQQCILPPNEYDRYNIEVREIKLLSSGSSGMVYEGIWHNHLVAIKKIHSVDAFEIATLINEIELLRSLKHPNILRLYDVYFNPFSILTELCPSGDLLHVINSKSPLHPIIAMRIVRDVIAAIGYLHNHHPPVIHCDVRLPNIFIRSVSKSANVCAVLGDVGFSRITDDSLSCGVRSAQNDLLGLHSVITSIIAKLLNDQLLQPTLLSEIHNSDVGDDQHNDSENCNENQNGKESRDCDDNDNNDDDNDDNNGGGGNDELVAKAIVERLKEEAENLQRSAISGNFFNLEEKARQLDDYIKTIYSRIQAKGNALIVNDPILSSIRPILSQSMHLETEKLSTDFVSELLLKLLDLLKQRRELQVGIDYSWIKVCSKLYPIFRIAIKLNVMTTEIIEELRSLQFIDVGNSRGINLVHLACKYGNSKVLSDVLFHLNTDPNSLTFHRKFSALHYAAINDHRTVIYVLHKYGANVNIVDKSSRTPLFLAAKCLKFDALLALLNLQADPNIPNSHFIPAIAIAARARSTHAGKRSQCIKALLQFGSTFFYDFKIEDEMNVIMEEVNNLLKNPYSSFARNNFTSKRTLLSWVIASSTLTT